MPRARTVPHRLASSQEPGRKRRWKASDARTVLAAQAASGLSLAAFARREGLSPTRMMWWRKQLRPRPGSTPPASPRWVPVTIRPSALVQAAAHVEIVIRGGRVIRLAGPFDVQAVAGLVRSLEEPVC